MAPNLIEKQEYNCTGLQSICNSRGKNFENSKKEADDEFCIVACCPQRPIFKSCTFPPTNLTPPQTASLHPIPPTHHKAPPFSLRLLLPYTHHHARPRVGACKGKHPPAAARTQRQRAQFRSQVHQGAEGDAARGHGTRCERCYGGCGRLESRPFGSLG